MDEPGEREGGGRPQGIAPTMDEPSEREGGGRPSRSPLHFIDAVVEAVYGVGVGFCIYGNAVFELGMLRASLLYQANHWVASACPVWSLGIVICVVIVP